MGMACIPTLAAKSTGPWLLTQTQVSNISLNIFLIANLSGILNEYLYEDERCLHNEMQHPSNSPLMATKDPSGLREALNFNLL